MTLLELNHISRQYRNGQVRIEALRGIDLAVEEGDFLSIMGPSGSVKSTLLVVKSPALPGNINPSTAEDIDVKPKVDRLLQEIIANGPLTSSNPYDYIKNSKAFAELVALGNPALAYMFDSFAQSNEDGLKEYIMASACAQILGKDDAHKGIGITSGREWFYKYGALAKEADFHLVDADYELFKDPSGKPKPVLPAHTDLKNMEDVISNYILSTNRRAYGMGEKAIEAHKIYRTEEKDGIINAYLLVRFNWFGFQSHRGPC